jgi:hypothetical protein
MIIFFLIYYCCEKIYIYQPEPLVNSYNNRDLEYKIADFGVVPYGQAIFGTLQQASPYDLCTI